MRHFVMTAVMLSLTAGLVTGCKSGECCDNGGTEKKAVKPESKVVSFGEPMTVPASQTVTVSQLMASPEKYVNTPVRITGTIDGVCEKKGCWATLTDGKAKEPLFVKFTCPAEENGRIVPLEAKGRPATVQGVVKIKEVSQEDARHYAEDAGKSKVEIEKIVGWQKQVTVSSPSVQVVMQ